MTLEQLEHLRSLSTEIHRYDEMAECLHARAERLTTTLTGMPSGTHDNDQLAGIIAEIVDNERKAAERVIQLRRECEEAEGWIDSLPDQQRRVMRAYYIDRAKTWQAVAEELPYSYRHCLRIKDAAHSKLYKDVMLCHMEMC